MRFLIVALIPGIWFVAIVTAVIVQYRKIRSMGQTLPTGQTLQQAFEQMLKGAALKRRTATPMQSNGLCVILGLIGAVFLAASIHAFVSTKTFLQTAARAPGHIINFESRRGSKGAVSYAPRIVFQTPNGSTVTFVTKVSTNLSWWPPAGSTVQVYYDPANPMHARMDHPVDLWFLPGFLFLFGGIFDGIVVLIMISRHKIPAPSLPPKSPSPGYEIPTIVR